MRAASPSSLAIGGVALAIVAILVGGAFIGMLAEAARDGSGAWAAMDAYLLRVVRFTLWQAILSTAVSIGPAIVVARALSRHPRFPGRAMLLRLFAVPLALPALVAALGVLALFGRAGLFADLNALLGGSPWPGVYGLSGILIAHAFFNIPLATRLLLQALDAVPADQWRLAAQLGMGAGASFRYVEWPVLRTALPGVAGLVFMLCVTSFTIVLTLGGGPAATTIEVAIYQSLRFDFDPARALALTVLQLGLTLVIVTVLFRLGANLAGEAALSVSSRRHAVPGPGETLLNAGTIALVALFVAGPIVAVVVAGLRADLGRLVLDPAVQGAIVTSLILALGAGLLCVALTWALVRGRHAAEARRLWRLERAMDMGASLILVVPAVVLGAGWFILLRRVVDVFAFAPVMVVAVNAAMAAPFALRAIRPAHDAAAGRHDRLCASLGISGLNRLRLIDWPVLRLPLATALAFAMALSLGDLGVIALFGSDAVRTLPYLLFQRLGSYRTADAAGLALFLAALCFALMWIAGATRRRGG